MSLEIICGASCRVPNRLAKARGVLLRARATPNTAPDKILHHGGANRAAPNENEHTSLRYHRRRLLHTNIAVQRAGTKTPQTKPPQGNFFSICFVLTEHLSACFSRATDVLPFCR
jgi:hypothetical protein